MGKSGGGQRAPSEKPKKEGIRGFRRICQSNPPGRHEYRHLGRIGELAGPHLVGTAFRCRATIKKYNEHFDDQHLEPAQILSKSSLVVSDYDIGDLEDAIKNFQPVLVLGNGMSEGIFHLKTMIDEF